MSVGQSKLLMLTEANLCSDL